MASLNQNVREGAAKFLKNATVRNTMMTVGAQGLDHLKLNNAPVISSPDRVIAYHLDEQLRSRRISIRVLRVWQYLLKYGYFTFAKMDFLWYPAKTSAHQRHFELCRTELSFLAFACC